MITGDHPGTARAIAEQLGIMDPTHPMVLTGPELDAMPFDKIREKVLACNVYARVSPQNKINIIRALQAEHKVS
jgi:Ca2+-transporting ATPase